MAHPMPFYIRDSDPPAKREILRAALHLFSRDGLAATSIRDIAAESGFTNPALYKHFPSKEALALHLFEASHRRVYQLCAATLSDSATFEENLRGYLDQWLTLIDDQADVLAFLADSARVLFPLSAADIQHNTIHSLACRLAAGSPSKLPLELAAAAIQGTLAEWARMLHLGLVPGPAIGWNTHLLTLFNTLLR